MKKCCEWVSLLGMALCSTQCTAVEEEQKARIEGPAICGSSTSDSDGDGWGYENGRSCRVVIVDSSSGDGKPTCSSTFADPDGDGWGYENGTSCRVSPETSSDASTPTSDGHPVCQSSDNGNGWGFESGRSCRVVYESNSNESGGASSAFWAVDFENSPVGTYADSNIRSDWQGVQYTMLKDNRVSVREENGNRYIRVKYPKGGVGPWDSGASWETKFDRSYNELYISYKIRFSSGFDFVKGGKLPGLAGGTANTGGDKPNGQDGWSGRLMWRPGGSVTQYLYHPDQPEQWGEDLYWNEKISTGRWIHVETRIVMNSPGQKNGIVQSWYDGKLALDRQNIRFRDVSSFAIDGFQFSTFFGGSGSDWAPSKDVNVDYDSFVFSDVPVTH